MFGKIAPPERLENLLESVKNFAKAIGEIKDFKKVHEKEGREEYCIKIERKWLFFREEYTWNLTIEKENGKVYVHSEIIGPEACFMTWEYENGVLKYFSISFPGKVRKIYERINGKLKKVYQAKL